MSENELNLEQVRETLAQKSGPYFWRSLEQVADTKEFREFLEYEYPHGTADFADPTGRRDFLKLMGFSLVMSFLSGCYRQPPEKIIPYVRAPENGTDGKPLSFATSMVWNGFAAGLLATSHMGRPIKIEGNPNHPDSLGATNIYHQAAIFDLYDPDRSKAVMNGGKISSWDAFTEETSRLLEAQYAKKGSGIRLLTESVLSPSLYQQIQFFLAKYPAARWHQYEPLNRDQARVGQQAALGQYADALLKPENADVIVSFDADFLHAFPGSLRYARSFMKRRAAHENARDMSRLYILESSPSVTGTAADHRLAASPAKIIAAAAYTAQKLGVSFSAPDLSILSAEEKRWLDNAAEDLRKAAGKSLILAGAEQPACVQALIYALNEKLGNAGQTVIYIDPVEAKPVEHIASLRDLTQDIKTGRVDMLFMLGGNPVYDAPADFEFGKYLRQVSHSVRLGLYEDETSAYCSWHIPAAHFLEIFSDARASDGTVSMIQPLIAPLYNGKSAHQILSLLLGKPEEFEYTVLQNHWKSAWGENGFEKRWNRAVHDGLIADSAFTPKPLRAKTNFTASELSFPALNNADMALIFRPDASIWDGRFANNGWLQELPKSISLLTWDNAALLSPALAQRLGVQQEQMLEIVSSGDSLSIPVWIVPGHADNTITLPLGYGRKLRGQVGQERGFNTYTLRKSRNLSWAAGTIKVKKEKYRLATTQTHHNMEGRELIRTAPVAEFLKDPHFAQHAEHHGEGKSSLYPAYKYEGNAWGMSVNLNACIGCNACVIACQSENNVPIVGKQQIINGREMHWIRIDRYYEGSLDQPEIHQQPVMCMHCENAPCEPVCPVGATVHSDEGLNEMVYNRCVGTRYCSNNCPYKVRRFNFYQFSDRENNSTALMQNPDVTVRNRGVMEKCTFCVQRINHARIDAKKEGREIQDGEVVTACQGSCPTQAIVFGNINDPLAAVTKLKKSPLNYGLLTELNTQPRLTYLAKVTNPNPALKG